MKYDFLIVGSGLFGATFAHQMRLRDKTCLVIERRSHIGGNVYTENDNGINVHRYGAHIFHTNDNEVWDYLNQFAEFNRFTNAPLANFDGEIYNLPFNMNTFYKLWGVTDPAKAAEIIDLQRVKTNKPKNLKEQAIHFVGCEIYEKLICGYTEKQWGRPCDQLPAFIIKRLPLRFTWDNNYYDCRFQGIPIGGYTAIIEKMLVGCDVRVGTDYFACRAEFGDMAKKVVYSGMLDEFYDYRYGRLDYRSLRFESEVHDIRNYQGNAVVNYTSKKVPYTRIIEHKHFEFGEQNTTIITREYPKEFAPGDEPYYPINDNANNLKYTKYKRLADAESNVIFGGRLADYKYYDMWQVVRNAIDTARNIL